MSSERYSVQSGYLDLAEVCSSSSAETAIAVAEMQVERREPGKREKIVRVIDNETREIVWTSTDL